MRHTRRNILLTLAFCGVAYFLGGCADGPFTELAGLNPYLRRKWREDEQYAPTWHARLAELRRLRDEAAALPVQRQQQVALQMAAVLRDESHSSLRREAVLILGRLSVPEAVPLLRAAQQDEDHEIRIAACQAWARRGGGEAVHVLAEALGSDQQMEVRMVAATQLARFNTPQAIEALGSALDDPDPALQYRAVQSLESATGQNYGHNIAAWREVLQGNPAPPPASLSERLRRMF